VDPGATEGGAYSFHDSHALMPEHDTIPFLVRVAQPGQVGAAKAAGADADQDLAGARLRSGAVN
jgi:hypothetical protein